MTISKISNRAQIKRSSTIGAFCIIEDDVIIGERNTIGSHVVVKKGTIIGDDNKIHAGVHIGVLPQDYHFQGESSRCQIGNGNVIREYATISKATGKNQATVVGNGNFIMTYVHVAHNVVIGDNTIVASGSQLGGHVELGDHATIGGLAGVHQFCRIGKYAMLGAKSYLNMDLPPYLLACGNRAVVYGVNIRGLERHTYSIPDIERIKEIYRLLYRSSCSGTRILELLERETPHNSFARDFMKFIRTSQRGILLKTKR
jgi:UDP-N-acetylglucosamine acyltransferase